MRCNFASSLSSNAFERAIGEGEGGWGAQPAWPLEPLEVSSAVRRGLQRPARGGRSFGGRGEQRGGGSGPAPPRWRRKPVHATAVARAPPQTARSAAAARPPPQAGRSIAAHLLPTSEPPTSSLSSGFTSKGIEGSGVSTARRCRRSRPGATRPAAPLVWTSLGPLPRWVPGPTTRWAPGTTRLALHGT
jgi:hypothetical protein